MKKFKYIVLICTTLFITSCGLSSSSSDTGTVAVLEEGWSKYETSDIAINYPNEWEIVGKENFTSNIPSGVIAVFRNNVKNEAFTANLNVMAIELNESISSDDFAKSNASKQESSLLSYEKIASKTITLASGDSAVSSEFKGKKSAADPIVNFKQILAVKNGIGYIVTAAYLPDEDEMVVTFIQKMLDSFLLN